jgi:hypothetical protein
LRARRPIEVHRLVVVEELATQQHGRVEDVEDAVIAVIYHRRLVVRGLVGLLFLVEVDSLVEGRHAPESSTRWPVELPWPSSRTSYSATTQTKPRMSAGHHHQIHHQNQKM